MSREGLQIKAQDADFLLKNPVLQEVFSDIREDFVQILEDGPADAASRDGVIIGLQVLRDIKSKLEEYITDATMETERASLTINPHDPEDQYEQ